MPVTFLRREQNSHRVTYASNERLVKHISSFDNRDSFTSRLFDVSLNSALVINETQKIQKKNLFDKN